MSVLLFTSYLSKARSKRDSLDTWLGCLASYDHAPEAYNCTAINLQLWSLVPVERPLSAAYLVCLMHAHCSNVSWYCQIIT